ncbi:hypothetical protein E2C01_052595 [Portunus trituberculatus]|uniref:Uncharacterized protein n=1 Tax=Portunus trituberculatus TaxID=210409 RepID=A0A5B7GMW7_PORTR|nr:hypothetical protein [Portunus trituberculatus]
MTHTALAPESPVGLTSCFPLPSETPHISNILHTLTRPSTLSMTHRTWPRFAFFSDRLLSPCRFHRSIAIFTSRAIPVTCSLEI